MSPRRSPGPSARSRSTRATAARSLRGNLAEVTFALDRIGSGRFWALAPRGAGTTAAASIGAWAPYGSDGDQTTPQANGSAWIAPRLPGEPVLGVVLRDIYFGFGCYEHRAAVVEVGGEGPRKTIDVPLSSEAND